MKKKRILLLAIHKLRDLPGLALLKVLLETRYGYEVMVSNAGALGLLVPSFQPHLVVFPWLWMPQDVAWAKKLKQMGIGVAVLLAEGFAHWEPQRLQMAGKFTDLSPVDIHFQWNDGIAELMRIHRTLPEERIFVAGVPRFDFYRSPFHRLLLTKAEFCERYRLRVDRPIVTWATNFGFVKYVGYPDAVRVAEKLNEAAGITDIPPYGSFSRGVSVEEASREILTAAVIRLASEFPNVNLVIKVHPGEDDKWYHRRRDSAGLTNMAIVGSEYIWDVLNSSDVHLHRTCTTGTEAWLMGKPTIDLKLNPDEMWFSEEMASGGDVARSSDELMERVSYYLLGGAIGSEKIRSRESLIHKWFHQVDGKSSERHADIIHDFLEAHPSEPRIPRDWRNLSMIAKARLRRLLGVEPYESLLEMLPFLRANGRSGDQRFLVNRDRYFTSAEVDAWVEKISGNLKGGGHHPSEADCWRAS
jgi:surface carbohydrate biosynthesis protein